MKTTTWVIISAIALGGCFYAMEFASLTPSLQAWNEGKHQQPSQVLNLAGGVPSGATADFRNHQSKGATVTATNAQIDRLWGCYTSERMKVQALASALTNMGGDVRAVLSELGLSDGDECAASTAPLPTHPSNVSSPPHDGSVHVPDLMQSRSPDAHTQSPESSTVPDAASLPTPPVSLPASPHAHEPPPPAPPSPAPALVSSDARDESLPARRGNPHQGPRSVYAQYHYMHPFDVVPSSYRPEVDVLPAVPKPANGRPASPEAVILTHDTRDWVGQGGYVEWFVLQNFLYTRRHLDMHFVYYRLLTRQERRNSVAAVHAFNKDLPQKYQTSVDLLEEHAHARRCPDRRSVDGCSGPRGCEMTVAWCKVKALKHATAVFPSTQFFMYLDSDAAVAPEYAHVPLPTYVAHMQAVLDFTMDDKPVVVTNELGGHGWSGYCDVMKGSNYSCFNMGVVLLKAGRQRGEGDGGAGARVQAWLDRWWELSEAGRLECEQDDAGASVQEGDTLIPMRCPPYHDARWDLRKGWPAEQPSVAYLETVSPYQELMQVSYPDDKDFQWNVRHRKNRSTRTKMGPIGVDCLSHYPQAHCFVQHFFAGVPMKQEESKVVRNEIMFQLRTCARVRALFPPSAAIQLCAEATGDDEGPSWSSDSIDMQIAQLSELLTPFVDTIIMV
mmetsp:Transcript_40726/g.77761  ORF Transcript_40726/g.77761 Transcript_40726/m.77761 type:complete len:671 (-) Transcript_40726:54-2066(-)